MGSLSIFELASTAIDPACLKTGIQLSHYIDVSQAENTTYCDLIRPFFVRNKKPNDLWYFYGLGILLKKQGCQRLVLGQFSPNRAKFLKVGSFTLTLFLVDKIEKNPSNQKKHQDRCNAPTCSQLSNMLDLLRCRGGRHQQSSGDQTNDTH
jgi:hypothetical protein